MESSTAGRDRGNHETQRLKANIEDQLNRLLTQLQDLEDNRDDFDEEEYEENRNDTIQQMKEFEISLNKMKEGNLTLVNDIGRIQLAIQDAIRKAFKSPEVMKMFAKRENGALRSRLNSIQQDYRLGKLLSDDYLMMSAEIIGALDKLGEILEPHERSLLENYTNNKAAYISATSEIDHSVMTTAANQANQALQR